MGHIWTQANLDTEPGALPLGSVNALSNLRRERLDPRGERSLLTSGPDATRDGREAQPVTRNGVVTSAVSDRISLSLCALNG